MGDHNSSLNAIGAWEEASERKGFGGNLGGLLSNAYLEWHNIYLTILTAYAL